MTLCRGGCRPARRWRRARGVAGQAASPHADCYRRIGRSPPSLGLPPPAGFINNNSIAKAEAAQAHALLLLLVAIRLVSCCCRSADGAAEERRGFTRRMHVLLAEAGTSAATDGRRRQDSFPTGGNCLTGGHPVASCASECRRRLFNSEAVINLPTRHGPTASSWRRRRRRRPAVCRRRRVAAWLLFSPRGARVRAALQ